MSQLSCANRVVFVVAGPPAVGKTAILGELQRAAADTARGQVSSTFSIDQILLDLHCAGRLRVASRITTDGALFVDDFLAVASECLDQLLTAIHAAEGVVLVELPLFDHEIYPAFLDIFRCAHVLILRAPLDTRILRNRHRRGREIPEQALREMQQMAGMDAQRLIVCAAASVTHLDTDGSFEKVKNFATAWLKEKLVPG